MNVRKQTINVSLESIAFGSDLILEDSVPAFPTCHIMVAILRV